MTRTTLGLILLIFFLGDLSAQKEDFIWVLGNRTDSVYSTKMDFNTQPVSLSGINGGVPRFNKTCTAISSKEGQLLFYTNGLHLFDRRHQIMENGDTLHPTDYTLDIIDTYNGIEGISIKQNVRILPWPDSPDIYFILHHSVPYDLWKHKDFDLLYSIVDMNKNNGFGKVIEKNQHVLNDTLAEGRLSACRHANGRDWWIFVRKIQTTPGYHRYLLNPSGLHYKGFQNIGRWLEHEYEKGGQSVFSPDGTRYASLALSAKYDSTGHVEIDSFGHVPYSYKIDLYNFDRCAGSLSEFVGLEVPFEQESTPCVNCYGLAFSPNSRFLYVSSCHKIFQFDLEASNIKASRQVVGEVDLFDPDCEGLEVVFCNMQLAPDGKIYIAGEDYCELSEIRYPDYEGMQCGAIPKNVQMITWNRDGIPDFPVYRLGPLDGSSCDTLDIERPPVARFRSDSLNSFEFRFTDISWYQPTKWQWSFGDGTTDTVQHPDHTYQDTGYYEVCLTVSNEDGEDTSCDTVHITDQSTGIHVPDRYELNIYPVPSDDYITIEGLANNTTLKIYNIRGKIVDRFEYAGSPARYRIDHLSPGIYWIKTPTRTGRFVRMK